MGSSTAILNHTIRLVQAAYEKERTAAERKRDRDRKAYTISDVGRKNAVWTTIAKQVRKEKADPAEWVKSQFAFGYRDIPRATNLTGDKALSVYREYISSKLVVDKTRVAKLKEVPDLVGYTLQTRIKGMQAYLASTTGTGDPDSLNAMSSIEDNSCGLDPLVLLLMSNQPMYMPMFARQAYMELKQDRQLLEYLLNNQDFQAKTNKIIRYVEQRSGR